MTNKAWKVLGFAAAGISALWLGNADVQAAGPKSTFDSGSSIAGMGAALDQYLDSQESEEEAEAALTQDKIRYETFRSIFSNLGVANVEGTLNIRKEPKNDADIVGKLVKHAGCSILSSSDGWYKIRSGQVTGYVYGQYLSVGQEALEIAYYDMKLMVRVNTETLRVRTVPGTDAEVIGRIHEGETYPVISQSGGGWMKIYYGNVPAYVYVPGNAVVAYTIPEAAPQDIRGRVVSYAVQFVGNRYQWGGTDPNTGADCSGFVQYVMEHAAGVALDRTSREQAREGQAVSSAQMLPGDLLFYSAGGTVNHVAMYIGDGQVVHAANSKSGIKISKWNYRPPSTIRRVLP